MNELHSLRNKLDVGRRKLINKTYIFLLAGANSTHAILSLIYSIFAQVNREEAEKLISFKKKFPWIQKGKDTVPEHIAKDVKALFDYLHALEDATMKLPKIIEGTTKLALKAVSLKDDLKKEIDAADEYTKAQSMKALPHNIKMLKRSKNVAQCTFDLIKTITSELKLAYETAEEEKSQFPEFGKICADEDIKTPLECYKKVGKEIPDPKKERTEEELCAFPYDKEEVKGEDLEAIEDERKDGDIIDEED
mmetsp:Transcript_1761/g.1547  ORF Transcript_1761/g.1547 Transcript_1761/m.1547 type:complete len:250 (+) Transcript_1761:253-1002(+)